MSLINDALKRASEADKKRPSNTGPPAPMLPAPERSRSIVPMLLGVLAVLLVAMAGVIISRALPRSGIVAVVPPPAPQTAVASSNDGRATLPRSQGSPSVAVVAPEQNPGSAGASPYRVDTSAGAAATNVSGGAAAPPYRSQALPAEGLGQGLSAQSVEVASLAFPELKLQGILYSRSNPRAVINGRTVREKELIGEVHVLTIAQSKVTVEWNGQTRDLKLEGP